MNLPLITSVGLPSSGRNTFMCMLSEVLHEQGYHSLRYVDLSQCIITQIQKIKKDFYNPTRTKIPKDYQVILMAKPMETEGEWEKIKDYNHKLVVHVIEDRVHKGETPMTPQWMFSAAELFIRNPGEFRRFNFLIRDLYFNELEPRLTNIITANEPKELSPYANRDDGMAAHP